MTSEALATFTVHVAPAMITARIVRAEGGAVRLQLEVPAAPAPLLTRYQVAALRELLSRAGQGMLEAEWTGR